MRQTRMEVVMTFPLAEIKRRGGALALERAVGVFGVGGRWATTTVNAGRLFGTD
jgi:hypothetical protein